MKDDEIKDRLDEVFRRVNTSPTYSQPSFDLPLDRILALRVPEVFDLIEDMSLSDVHRLVQLAMRFENLDREAIEEFEAKTTEIVREVFEESLPHDRNNNPEDRQENH
jgi:hypothetical protein